MNKNNNEPNQNTADRAGSYEQLKSWYLARLRKQALEMHDKNLTPAGLIRADRNLIESLVLGSSSPRESSSGSEMNLAPAWRRLAAVYFGLIIVQFFLLFNATNGNLIESLQAFMQLTLGTLALSGPNHDLYSKLSSLAIIVPLATFATPCLLSLCLAPLCEKMKGKSALAMSSASTWLLPGSFIFGLLLILLAVPCMNLASVDAASAASDSLWHSLFFVSCWGLVVLACFSTHLVASIRLPMQSLYKSLEDSSAVAKSSEAAKFKSGYPNELKAHLAELIRTRDELSSRETLIADVSPDLLFVLTPEEKIVCCNWTSQNLLGFLPEELTTKALSELVLPEDISTVRASLASVQRDRQAGSFECRLQTKTRKAVDMRCAVEFSATHNCFFASAHDISDQKTLERAKREFISMLGHDIRLPLSSALLTVQVLERGIYGEIPATAENMLSEVELSLKRLVTLLEELLEFEQLAAGKMRLDTTVLETEQLIAQTLAELSGHAQKKEISLQPVGDNVQLNGDSGKLVRVLVNLVSNAIKFSPPQSKIIVSTQCPRSGTVEIRVKDQGPGIAPEYQKLVFERYERLESTSHEQGTGLGLAIARSIVESHGGMIGVDSTPGDGSTFWFTLPMRSELGRTGILETGAGA